MKRSSGDVDLIERLPCLTSGDVVLIERLPYPAWRLLNELLWADFSFSYFCLPKFNSHSHGSITLLLLGNGGPTHYKTPVPHPLPTGGACAAG